MSAGGSFEERLKQYIGEKDLDSIVNLFEIDSSNRDEILRNLILNRDADLLRRVTVEIAGEDGHDYQIIHQAFASLLNKVSSRLSAQERRDFGGFSGEAPGEDINPAKIVKNFCTDIQRSLGEEDMEKQFAAMLAHKESGSNNSNEDLLSRVFSEDKKDIYVGSCSDLILSLEAVEVGSKVEVADFNFETPSTTTLNPRNCLAFRSAEDWKSR